MSSNVPNVSHHPKVDGHASAADAVEDAVHDDRHLEAERVHVVAQDEGESAEAVPDLLKV